MPVGPERLTRAQLREAIRTDMGGVVNNGFRRRLSIGYGEFFRPLSKKEERSERNKSKSETTNLNNQD